jgi:hypothetical protein
MCGCGCNRCKSADAFGQPVPHSGAVTAAPLLTHPASYNGGVEPTGSTRATAIRQEAPGFARGMMVENPGTNQDGIGRPSASPFGRALRAIMGARNVVRLSPPVMPPVAAYRGFLGIMLAKSAPSVIVPKGTSYTGQLPLTQQPKVPKPRPWVDGVLGARYTG